MCNSCPVKKKKSKDFYNNDRDMYVFWSIHKIYIFRRTCHCRGKDLLEKYKSCVGWEYSADDCVLNELILKEKNA